MKSQSRGQNEAEIRFRRVMTRPQSDRKRISVVRPTTVFVVFYTRMRINIYRVPSRSGPVLISHYKNKRRFSTHPVLYRGIYVEDMWKSVARIYRKLSNARRRRGDSCKQPPPPAGEFA